MSVIDGGSTFDRLGHVTVQSPKPVDQHSFIESGCSVPYRHDRLRQTIHALHLLKRLGRPIAIGYDGDPHGPGVGRPLIDDGPLPVSSRSLRHILVGRCFGSGRLDLADHATNRRRVGARLLGYLAVGLQKRAGDRPLERIGGDPREQVRRRYRRQHALVTAGARPA